MMHILQFIARWTAYYFYRQYITFLSLQSKPWQTRDFLCGRKANLFFSEEAQLVLLHWQVEHQVESHFESVCEFWFVPLSRCSLWDFSSSSSGLRLIGAAYCLLTWKPWGECPQGVGWARSDCLENGCAQKEQLCTVKTPTIQGREICDETQEQPAVLCIMFLLCWGGTLGLTHN